MSIDSHPESYVLVQTASPYSPGKYVNWNLSFFNGDPVYSYVNSSRSPVRPYKNCTGQVWYVHWFSSRRADVSIWTASPYSPGKYVNMEFAFYVRYQRRSCNTLCELSSRSPVRDRTRTVTGQVWYVHWFSSLWARFRRSKRLVPVRSVLGSMVNWNLSFWINCSLILSY